MTNASTRAAARNQKRGLRGLSELRLLLRQLPDEITNDVRKAVRDGAALVQFEMLRMVPKDSGELARTIQTVISADGLSAVVGPGVKALRAEQARQAVNRRRQARYGSEAIRAKLSAANQETLFEAYKALWIERGTKGAPARNIPAQPARPFIQPAMDVNREAILGSIRGAVRTALRRVARSGGVRIR